MDTELEKRFRDLAERSYRSSIYTFTGFLSLLEQEEFHRLSREFKYTDHKLYGGSVESERKVLRFGDDSFTAQNAEFPISIVLVSPLQAKYSDDLTHRDFLGALLNLGIVRSTIGDIVINDNSAAVFCLNHVAPVISDNLLRVKHTSVSCRQVQLSEYEAVRPERRYQTITESVSSQRIDLVLAKLCKLSRSEAVKLFTQKLVFVNERLQENNSAVLRAGDVLTVRGYGKFIYDGEEYINKKGKTCIRIRKYLT